MLRQLILLSLIPTLFACSNSKPSKNSDKPTTPQSEKASNGGYYEIEEFGCNGSFKPGHEGDRIYLHTKRQIIGIGFTNADNCRIVDFQDYVVSATNNYGFDLVPRSKIGRRSSCTDDVTEFGGIEFKKAMVFNKGMIVLSGTGDSNCELLTFKLKK